MTASWRLATGLIFVAALTACDPPPPSPATGAAQHAPTLDRQVRDHTVAFAGTESSLNVAARRRLDGFLRAHRVRGRDTLRVAAALTTPPDLGAQRRDAVLRTLRRLGYRPRAAEGSGGGVSRPEKGVRVRLEQYVVDLPDCPDTTRTRINDLHNLPASDFGCSTHRNLGLMVAEPRDLLRGRTLSPGDGARQARGVRDYRRGRAGGGAAAGSVQTPAVPGGAGTGGGGDFGGEE